MRASQTPVQDKGEDKRSTVVSVRLPLSVASKLQAEASSRRIGTGELAKEVLTNHASWGSLTARVPLISVPPALVVKMLGLFSDTEITQLARYSGRLILSQIGDVFGGKGPETFLGLLKTWLENSRMTVTYTSGDRISCLVLHGMGRKWSFYLAKMIETVLGEASLGHRFRFEAKDRSLAFTTTLRHHF